MSVFCYECNGVETKELYLQRFGDKQSNATILQTWFQWTFFIVRIWFIMKSGACRFATR